MDPRAEKNLRVSWTSSLISFGTNCTQIAKQEGGDVRVLPEKLVGSVRTTSQKTKISSANCPTLFRAWTFYQNPVSDLPYRTNVIKELWRAFVDGLIDSDNDEKVASSKNLKNIPNSRLECKTYIPFGTKVAKIATLFLTRTAENPYPLGPHIPT